MRLTPQQVESIKHAAVELFGADASVFLFGSRVDDELRGGDVDLMVEVASPVDQAVMKSARFGGRIRRLMHGRRVDVLLAAPNLSEQAIHRIAREQGVRL